MLSILDISAVGMCHPTLKHSVIIIIIIIIVIIIIIIINKQANKRSTGAKGCDTDCCKRVR